MVYRNRVTIDLFVFFFCVWWEMDSVIEFGMNIDLKADFAMFFRVLKVYITILYFFL